MLGKLLLAALLATALSSAQGRRGGGMGDDEGGADVFRPPQLTRDHLLAEKLKLDKGQKEQLQGILKAAAEEAGPLRTQMGNARIQLAGALIEGKGDQAVQQAQEAYSALAAQMAGIEAKAFAKICAMLKPNQQSRATQGFELLAGLIEVQEARGHGTAGGAGPDERGERGR
jgi:hypothetical protein